MVEVAVIAAVVVVVAAYILGCAWGAKSPLQDRPQTYNSRSHTFLWIRMGSIKFPDPNGFTVVTASVVTFYWC